MFVCAIAHDGKRPADVITYQLEMNRWIVTVIASMCIDSIRLLTWYEMLLLLLYSCRCVCICEKTKASWHWSGSRLSGKRTAEGGGGLPRSAGAAVSHQGTNGRTDEVTQFHVHTSRSVFVFCSRWIQALKWVNPCRVLHQLFHGQTNHMHNLLWVSIGPWPPSCVCVWGGGETKSLTHCYFVAKVERNLYFLNTTATCFTFVLQCFDTVDWLGYVACWIVAEMTCLCHRIRH